MRARTDSPNRIDLLQFATLVPPALLVVAIVATNKAARIHLAILIQELAILVPFVAGNDVVGRQRIAGTIGEREREHDRFLEVVDFLADVDGKRCG